MKPHDPDTVEVTYNERLGYKHGSNHLAKETRAKSRNVFFKKFTWYAVSLLPDGFKLKIPSMSDKRLLKTNRCGHIMVTGVEPGMYDIIEQTEDYIIAKKQK